MCSCRHGRFWDETGTAYAILGVTMFTNLGLYIDRGIIPGAPKQFEAFVLESEPHTHSLTALYGLLSTVYIAGYAIGAVGFGYLSTTGVRAFRLVSFGLAAWLVALIVCGFAPNYWVLLAARACSGIGESAFQTILVPFLDDFAPGGRRGLALALFYVMIPVGTAVGYGWGSGVAGSTLGWRWAFFLEAIIFSPSVLFYYFVHAPEPQGMGKRRAEEGEGDEVEEEEERLLEEGEEKEEKEEEKGEVGGSGLSAWERLLDVLRSPVFWCIAIGYASFNFTVAGLGALGPLLMLELGLVKTESIASTIFGAVVAGAGLLGTGLGGWALDLLIAHRTGDRDPATDRPSRLLGSLDLMAPTMVLAAGFAIVAVFLDAHLVPFIIFITLSCIAVFLSNAACNLAAITSVPVHSRAFAIGVCQIVQHAFGDVPSPTVIGLVADALAPPHGKGPTARRSPQGLRWTLLILMAWLIWGVLGWGVAWVLARRRRQHAMQEKLMIQ